MAGRAGVYVRVDVSGPLYDGAARAAAYKMIDKTKSDLADIGLGLLHGASAQFRAHPTWQWEAGLSQKTLARNDVLLLDAAPWNLWLEAGVRGGGSPRGRYRSRKFRGYGMWRQTARRLRGAARSVLQRNISDFIAGMGGT